MILTGPETETISFPELRELLLSKDQDSYERLSVLNSQCKFLDAKTDLTGDRIAMQSFVRSGNTFLRKYLEEITGVFTGADMHISHTFFESMMGLLGQYITNDSNRVWITKTHWPHSIPGDKAFPAEKMIVIARNPIDVFPSFANLVNTHSHSLQVNERFDQDKPEFWEQWVRKMTINMRDNHRNVLDEIAPNIPVYFLRYEDLKLKPEPVLIELFRFLLDADSLQGTLCERRIKEVAALGFSTKTAYALKSTSNSLCRNRHMYNEQQMATMREELAEMIAFWGYNKGDTCFFYGVDSTSSPMTYKAYNQERTLS